MVSFIKKMIQVPSGYNEGWICIITYGLETDQIRKLGLLTGINRNAMERSESRAMINSHMPIVLNVFIVDLFTGQMVKILRSVYVQNAKGALPVFAFGSK